MATYVYHVSSPSASKMSSSRRKKLPDNAPRPRHCTVTKVGITHSEDSRVCTTSHSEAEKKAIYKPYKPAVRL